MSAEALTAIAAALSQEFKDELARAWNRTAVLASSIPVKAGVGKNAAWDVEFSTGGAAAAAHADGSDVAGGEYGQDPIVPATLPWALYRAPFSLSLTEIAAAFTSSAVNEAVRDIFGERMIGSMTKLASVINADCFSGTGTDGGGNPNIIGLTGGGALDATGIYAGINRATYSEWGGNVLSNGGVLRPLTIDLMDQQETNTYVASGEKPNLWIADPGVRRKYKSLFEANRRIVTGGPAPTQMGASNGAVELDYDGTSVLRDRNAPAGYLLSLNTNWLEMKVLKVPGIAGYDIREVTLPSSNGVAMAPTALVAQVLPLALTGDAVKMNVFIKLQLCVKKPNRMGYIKDLQT